MRLFKLTLFFMFISFNFSCAAQQEVQVKRYEDYFPASNNHTQNKHGSDYDVYSDKSSYNLQVTDEGRAYSDDGFFQEIPVEIDTAIKSTGKCKAVVAPGPKKVGKPYKINGITYYPMERADGYSEIGIASWYGPGFHGNLTANGETYNQKAMTAAHKTLPLPTLVKVENLENGKHVVVRVNDRGPYSKGRIIDLTEVAARRLDMLDKGTARVRVSVLSEDPDCYVAYGHEVHIDNGNFAVQIGAFVVETNAYQLATKFGSRAIISKGYAKGTEWNRVWIIGYPTKEKALQATIDEFAEYSGAFVVRYE